MTTSRHVAPARSAGGRWTAAVRPPAVAAAIGVAVAAVVALLRTAQLPAGMGALDMTMSGAGVGVWVALSVVPAAVIGLLGPAGPATAVARGLVIGLLWWVSWNLTLLPLLLGVRPGWSSASVTVGFADLVATLLHGAVTGLGWSAVAARVVGVARGPDEDRADLPRVVVLGGGFAGVAVARRLERLARRRSRWDVTLVSDRNFLLFTPMLPEVAGGAVQAQHVGAALRAACPRTRVVLGRVDEVDLRQRVLRVGADAIPYDHLVLVLGTEPTFHGLPGIAEHCLTLKSLHDAARVRAHLLTQLERADLALDETERRRLLTCTVVGGGFAGVELLAELQDLTRSVLRYYPSLEATQLRFVLVHSGDRILPELGAKLAQFADERLRSRGLEIMLGTRVRGASKSALVLEDGTEIASGTMVWTAGNQPSELVRSLATEHARNGAVVVDATLRAVGVERVWAAGDCAAVPAGEGKVHPPTAQHALRQGRTVADNLAAVIAGREPKPFRFTTIGMLAALGHRTGVAEIRGWRFSGVLAWAMWRVIYLAKLPGLEKRIRVALDWLVEIAFPRDLVLAQEVPDATGRLGPAPEPSSR